MRSIFSMFLAFIFLSVCTFGAVQVGVEVVQKVETPHPYVAAKGVVWEKTFHSPNAGYIAIHFSKFKLAKGDRVEISSPDGNFLYVYKENGKAIEGGKKNISKFWATHIPGDTAVVRLISKKQQSGGYGFLIDKWVRGYERELINSLIEDVPDGDGESLCSSDDKEWAKCYLGTTIYDKGKAICRLLINGSSACTGWLLGSEGHVMTNNHCIGTSSDAANTDFEFMAEGATCTTNCASWGACPGTVVANSSTFIQTDSALDYTLVKLPTNVSTTYGYLQLRETLPTVGERMYIPQHPSAYGKMFAVNSDVDGGYAVVYSRNETPCSGGPGDIGYYADTAGGSSGSPVLGYSDHLVIALHHCADCPNRGVPIPSIITDLGSNIPNDAIGGTPVAPVAEFTGSPTTLMAGGSVAFTDQSTNSPTSWSWTFTGGTPSSSTAQNPTVTYNTAGTYTVTLVATNAAGSDSETKTGYIVVNAPQLPVADFTASPTTVEEGSTVQFTDQTTNTPLSWSWSFPGGTPSTSTAQNPTVTYNTVGTYNVTLTATNSAGSDGETKTGYITVTEVQPTIGITTVYSTSSTNGSRRAMPFTMSENGTITSVSMYHTGGSGSMILAVYGGTSAPSSRLAITPTTTVSGSTGWQTINLTSPVYVASGTKIWLAWVYQTNPGIRYQVGSPGRYQSSDTWAGGMPDPFGTGSQGDYLYSIYANYTTTTPTQYTLTTNTSGQGSVTLSPSGGTYVEGTTVTLTPVPDAGWEFTGWSGDLSGSDNPATIVMNSNKTVTATFSEIVVPQYTLTTNTVGQGSITLSPTGGTYDEDTVVTLTPVPASGWLFVGWSGDLSGTANPATITMTANKSVTATFTEAPTTGTVGSTTVYSTNSVNGSRRAMPYTMPENGTITSISMYHTGGSGSMILAVYDGTSSPGNRIAVTTTTAVSSTTGWQTINLQTPVYVASGTTVWLAWVYEDNPGIRYQTGSPGRYQSTDQWSGGMPTTFGSGSQTNYLYSIYATYTIGTVANAKIGAEIEKE